jgi:hypothetical protein
MAAATRRHGDNGGIGRALCGTAFDAELDPEIITPGLFADLVYRGVRVRTPAL